MFSYIYLFFAAFYGSSISAILPFHLCPLLPLSFPCQCTSPNPFTLFRPIHSTLIFICTNIFLACSSFLLFLSPAVSLLCYVFFAFSFASAWFYCPIRFVKHFTFVAHMNFKFLKMFQSFRSLLLCRCVCVCPQRVCGCRPEAGTSEGRKRTPKC